MSPIKLQLLAAGLEILGTLLLASEALILYGLREIPLRFSTGTEIRISPIARNIRASHRRGEPWGLYIGIFLLLAAVLADAALVLNGFSSSVRLVGFRTYSIGSLLTDVLVLAPATFVAFITLNYLEPFIIETLSFPLLLTLVLLKLWNRHSGSGAMGVLGFIFLLTGASLRAYLDLLGT